MPKVIRQRASRSDNPWNSFRLGQKMAASKEPLNTKNIVQNLISNFGVREASSIITVPEEEFLCSQCKGLLYRPVTAPCGHSFCAKCSVKDLVTCQHCQKEQSSVTFSKLNLTLESIVQTWYEKEYEFCSYIHKGKDLMSKNMYESAEQEFSEALKLRPFNAHALANRAIARSNQECWHSALTDVVNLKLQQRFGIEKSICKTECMDDVIAQRTAISKQIVKIFLEVLSMLNKSNPAFQDSGSSSDFKHVAGWLETSDSISPDIHSHHHMSKAMVQDEGQLPLVLSECESVLDAVILENLSSSNFETLISEAFEEAPNRTSPMESEFLNKFDEDDYSCILCTKPFYDPVCTPCGHTFCLDCLERCFDHGQSCPMCKTTLTEIYQFQKFLLSVDWSVDSFIKRYLPNLCQEREKLREEEHKRLSEKLPVFVCTVAFPRIKTMLHVFEPRYRLMIRRAVKFHDDSFGMSIPSATTPFHCVGTTINLENVSFYADGRSLVTATGSSRFTVEEYGSCDGYATAKVSTIIDEEETNQETREETKQFANEVYAKAKEWFGNCSQNFTNTTKMIYGDFPEQDPIEGPDGPKWAWWVLAALPLQESIKAFVLGKNRFRARLNIMNLVLGKIRNSGNNNTPRES